VKLATDCFQCLQRLIYRASELATDDLDLRQKARQEAEKVLIREFSPQQLSIVIASRIHEVIKEITRNPDPYRAVKEREMQIAREACIELGVKIRSPSQRPSRKRSDCSEETLVAHLKLAAAANAIDFFSPAESIRQEMTKSICFAIDHSKCLYERLRQATKVLYLADNAGEVYFDLPLVRYIEQFAPVTYVVKPEPVQDDITLEDIKNAGLENEFSRIIDTGIASPGIILPLASMRFQQEFDSADLILAKGMGHYEALSELTKQGRFFYCLKAKCKPVANALSVDANSYVAMLQ